VTLYSMTDLGVVQYLGGEPEKALPLLQLAEEHWETHEGGEPPVLAQNSFILARAIWESGGNRARARELARKAAEAFAAIGDAAAAAEARAWLRRH
jgi:hypothetical protein